MIRITAALLLLLAATHPQAAPANTSACYNIQDADARTYCLALAHNEPSQCYSVQHSGLRSRCLAEVYGGRKVK